MKSFSLCDCLIGERVCVLSMDLDNEIKRRFLDIGLSKNTEVIPLFDSISGGIRAYKIRNSLIAIRDSDARGIMVISCNE